MRNTDLKRPWPDGPPDIYIYIYIYIRVSQIETMYSRDNVFLENRHSLENVYNVFSENTPLKKFTYPIFLDGRGKARGGQQPCSRPGAARRPPGPKSI